MFANCCHVVAPQRRIVIYLGLVLVNSNHNTDVAQHKLAGSVIISLLAHFDRGLSVFRPPGAWPSERRRYRHGGDNERPEFVKKKLAEDGGFGGPQRSAERRGGKNRLFSAALSLTRLCLSWRTNVNLVGTSTRCGSRGG